MLIGYKKSFRLPMRLKNPTFSSFAYPKFVSKGLAGDRKKSIISFIGKRGQINPYKEL